MVSRALRWTSSAGLVVALLGCDRDLRAARELLESDGFVDLELSGDGPYEFVGSRGDYHCFGTVLSEKHDGVRRIDVDAHCRLRPILCTQGDADVCVELGEMHDQGNRHDEDDIVEPNRERATELFTRACELGRFAMCVEVGHRHRDGVGTAVDQPRAASFYARACDGGSADGCYDLGECTAQGRGVARDAERAARLFAKACVRGHDEACARARLP